MQILFNYYEYSELKILKDFPRKICNICDKWIIPQSLSVSQELYEHEFNIFLQITWNVHFKFIMIIWVFQKRIVEQGCLLFLKINVYFVTK